MTSSCTDRERYIATYYLLLSCSNCSSYVHWHITLCFSFQSFYFSRDHNENKAFRICIMLSLPQHFYTFLPYHFSVILAYYIVLFLFGNFLEANTYLLTCLFTYLLTCLLAYLPTYLFAYLLTCLLAYLLTCLLGYLVTWLLGYLVTWLLGYLVTWLLNYLIT